MKQQTIFAFNTLTNIEHWVIIDDAVMGGQSSGNFQINKNNCAKFYGEVSLENNGGFSSVRYREKVINVENFTKLIVHLKGDGKRYQFRIKENLNQKQSYVAYFPTSGDWETIEIDLADLVPKFRGRIIDLPSFSGNTIAELGFLYGNKKAESFELLIDSITLQ